MMSIKPAVYKIKSSGPRTDPCGMPYQTVVVVDRVEPHRTVSTLPVRYLLISCVLPLATAPSMRQPRGPGTSLHWSLVIGHRTLVSRRRHLSPRSGASSRNYFLPEAIPTTSTTHEKSLSSCAANSIFLFDVIRCPCSHFDITPPKSVL